MLQHNDLVLLLGGVAFFMYGMSLCSHFLEKLMINRVRLLLNKLSTNSFLAILVGAALTVLLQSSGAVTSMLVGLGSAGVITLSEVMGVIIGSAVGSTLTVQLISFNIAQWGLLVFIGAFSVYFIAKKDFIKKVMGVLMGFGLLFFGMELIGLGANAIAKVPFVTEIFKNLSGNPWASLLVATCFSGFVHSSAVTIGLAMGFTQAGMISMYDAFFWVLGANIGTTSTALMASIGGNYIGRQVAWAHFFYKAVSVLIFSYFAISGVNWVMSFSVNEVRAIANAHLVLNVVSAILFFPFIRWVARFIEFLFPKGSGDKVFGAKFLRRETYSSSAIAETYASREIMRMADIVMSMARDSIRLFEEDDQEIRESIEERDNMVDHLFREIKDFLLGEEGVDQNDEVNKSVMEMIMFASDLESAADIIDHTVLDLSRKKNYLKLEFSEEGWREIKKMHTEMLNVCALGVNCFIRHELAENVINSKRALRKLENNLRQSHIERLNQGMRESINTSSIHLDLLSEYRRVSSLISNHAYKYKNKLKP